MSYALVDERGVARDLASNAGLEELHAVAPPALRELLDRGGADAELKARVVADEATPAYVRELLGELNGAVTLTSGIVEEEEVAALAYNPDQPRDPEGTSTGGQWTSGGSKAKLVSAWEYPDAQPGGADYAHLRNPKTSEGKAFTAVLNDLPVHDGVTYRGMVLGEADVQKFTAKNVTIKLHSSASRDEAVARNFISGEATGNSGRAVLLELHGRGRDINSKLSLELRGTKEVVIQAGTRYAFAGLQRHDAENYVRIKLREIR